MSAAAGNTETLLPLKTLLSAVRGVFVGRAENLNTSRFTSVSTDSRTAEKDCLFVPLVGHVQDGHKFIPQAIERGASVILINQTVYRKNTNKYMEIVNDHPYLSFIAVENTLAALQDAAAAYAAQFPHLVRIGVTGSSGKTTTKDLIVAVLRQKYNVVYSHGNLNSETGLPLSVFTIRKEHEVGVFEMGMNRRGEIEEGAAVLRPEYAVLTNIGTAHVGILGSRENIAEEKRKIFKYVPETGAAFVPAADDFADFVCEGVRGRTVRYGDSVPAEKSGAEFVRDEGLDGTVFKVGGEEVRLRLPGIYNYRNALAAVAVGREFGLSAGQIKAGIESVSPADSRMERLPLTLRSGVSVNLIKDCYNANPDSARAALDFCNQLELSGDRIYILGDMLELGGKSAEAHSEIGVRAVARDPKLVILIGSEMKYASAAVKQSGYQKSLYIPDTDGNAMALAAQLVIDSASDGDLILLKGSRAVALERIAALVAESEGGGK